VVAKFKTLQMLGVHLPPDRRELTPSRSTQPTHPRQDRAAACEPTPAAALINAAATNPARSMGHR